MNKLSNWFDLDIKRKGIAPFLSLESFIKNGVR